MAEIKDKVVTVESLSILHEHNRNTYMPTVDPIGSGTMTMNGNGNFSGDVNASSLTINSEVQLVPMGNGLKFVFGSDSNDMVAETYVNATSLSAIHYWTKTSSTGSSSSIVVSADSSAFPKNGGQDGFTYVYQGTLDSISTEPVIRSITITGNGTYTAPSGVDGYSPVTVNVSSSETSAPTITVDSSGLIRATAGTKSTTKQLGVSDDSDFLPSNIKSGVSIFGVTGTLSVSYSDIEASSLSDVHYWTKTGSVASYEEVYNSSGAGISYGNSIIQYSDEITILDGSLTLVNPSEFTATSDEDEAEAVLLGKYIYGLDKFYKIPTDASIIYSSPTQYTSASLRATSVYDINLINDTEQSSSAVISTNRSAYPENGEQDGFTYVYQGTLDVV